MAGGISAIQPGMQQPMGEDQELQLRDTLRNLKKEHLKAWLNFFRNVIDLPVIAHFMGSNKVSPTQAGVMGAITSGISLYGLYGSW